MGIRREQPGAAKAAATAGAAIGKAERAKEDRARAEREQARADQEAAQRAAQQKAMEFELFKMEQRSMQDFQQELRDKQYRFDEINTAKEWDIEKKRRHSEIDFEIEEKERLRQKQEISNKRTAIEKDIASGKSTKEEHELALFNLDRDEYAIDVGAARGAPLTQMPKEPKPRSAVSQVSEIDATFELEGYTAQDLRDVGLDPADFPGIAEDESGYAIGQVVPTPQGDATIVGFDVDGEPMAELIEAGKPATQRIMSDVTSASESGGLSSLLLGSLKQENQRLKRTPRI